MLNNIDEARAECLNSLLHFTKVFYKLRTGREFRLSCPHSRESHYIQICRELTKVFKGEITILNINIPPRYGKAIDVATPMLTRNGWATAGAIKVGDELVGSKGWTKVTAVYPQGVLPAKQVTFSDSQAIACNDDHLWAVCDRYTPKFKALKTSQIADTLREADGRKHWRIPIVDGNYAGSKPFIDPYIFGCWLGDGHTHYAAITTMDDGIVNAFASKGHAMRLHKYQSAGKAKTYGIVGNGFNKTLRLNNLLHNKHIPQDVYLWGKGDRLALLQGLMDTDGTCGKNGQPSFTNTNKDIINGCAYLVNSLGGTYRIYTRKCGTQTLNIRLPDGIDPFRLKRKLQYVPKGNKCSPRRFVASIDEVSPCEMVCFTVDADDHLFAAGKGLILTHNTEILIHFVAWAMARYPDCNFIYTCYSHTLATKATQTIREIMQLPAYRRMFHVELSDTSQAKDNFATTKGGTVYACGTGGTITGHGAGVKGVNDRFSGAFIIDDSIKPDEATSDTVREGITNWYYNTAQSRMNNGNATAQINIGQRVHEGDLTAHLVKNNWHSLILPALDIHNNALDDQMHTTLDLLAMREKEPYVFAAQYQQDPQPAGGGIFKVDWFPLLDDAPNIMGTFITADTAETSKTYNDPSVFSFWGLYKILNFGQDSGLYGLHWLDCRQIWVEPKDLKSEFLNFYTDCMRFKVQPHLAAIEKKSTGSTLLSVLSDFQGMIIMDVERTKASGSKADRFLEMQPYVSSKRITMPANGQHTKMVLEHMKKITANNSHAHDDICDTAYDAVNIALIKKLISGMTNKESTKKQSEIVSHIANYQLNLNRQRRNALWN